MDRSGSGARVQYTRTHVRSYDKICLPSRRWIVVCMLVMIILQHSCRAFAPLSGLQLKSAITACLKLSQRGICLNSPNGAIGTWDVSRVIDMRRMFSDAKFFDADISTWDVSRVKDMRGMFLGASSYNGDLSKWDVSSVKDMSDMFRGATVFKRNLCGAAWVHSKAKKTRMFEGSSGSISRNSCNGAFKPTSRHQLHSAVSEYSSCASAQSDVGGKYPILGDESIMSKKNGESTTVDPVQKDLLYGADVNIADRICRRNRHYAEPSGYFLTKSWVNDVKDKGEVTYYDSVTGKPLFVAPKVRQFCLFSLLRMDQNKCLAVP